MSIVCVKFIQKFYVSTNFAVFCLLSVSLFICALLQRLKLSWIVFVYILISETSSVQTASIWHEMFCLIFYKFFFLDKCFINNFFQQLHQPAGMGQPAVNSQSNQVYAQISQSQTSMLNIEEGLEPFVDLGNCGLNPRMQIPQPPIYNNRSLCFYVKKVVKIIIIYYINY